MKKFNIIFFAVVLSFKLFAEDPEIINWPVIVEETYDRIVNYHKDNPYFKFLSDTSPLNIENYRAAIKDGTIKLVVYKNSYDMIESVEFQNKVGDVIGALKNDQTELKNILGLSLYYILQTGNYTKKDPVYLNALQIDTSISNSFGAPSANSFNEWLVYDKSVVFSLLQSLEQKRLLRLKGKTVSSDYIAEVVKKPIVILISKRKSDEIKGSNEIQKLTFYQANELDKEYKTPLFDEFVHYTTFQYLAEAKDQYLEIRNGNYWKYRYRPNVEEHLRISAFDPELRFLYSESYSDVDEEDYTAKGLSFFGKWGYDNIPILGFYSDEYIIGLKYSIFESKQLGLQNIERLRFSLGFVMDVDRPFVSIATNTPFLSTGTGPYGEFKYRLEDFEAEEWYKKPFQYLLEYVLPGDEAILSLDAKFSTNTYKPNHYSYKSDTEFFTLRHYVNVGLKMYPFNSELKIGPDINLGKFSWSFGWNPIDVPKFLFSPNRTVLVDLERDKRDNFARWDYIWYTKFGLENFTGNSFHSFEIFYNYNSHQNYQYLGAKLEIMYFDTAGFQIQTAIGIPKRNLEGWSKDYYLVFSPIIKIDLM